MPVDAPVMSTTLPARSGMVSFAAVSGDAIDFQPSLSARAANLAAQIACVKHSLPLAANVPRPRDRLSALRVVYLLAGSLYEGAQKSQKFARKTGAGWARRIFPSNESRSLDASVVGGSSLGRPPYGHCASKSVRSHRRALLGPSLVSLLPS